MNVALRVRSMTRDEFFAWAQAEGGRHEFDGTQPVQMTGGSVAHSRICLNLQAALRRRLEGSSCECFGGDAGVGTVGQAVRYPDASVTRTHPSGEDYLLPEVVVVFEVVSKTSGRTDRIIKVREYQAVPSIRRYIIVERVSVGLTLCERANESSPWTVSTLVAGDTLDLPEAGIAVPVDEIYQGITFTPGEGDD